MKQERDVAIRALYRKGETLRAIAKRYDLSHESIRAIVNAGGANARPPGRPPFEASASKEVLDTIFELYAGTASIDEIAKETGLTRGVISGTSRRMGLSKGKKEIACGTVYKYRAYKCRCSDCRKAAVESYMKAVRKRRAAGKCSHCDLEAMPNRTLCARHLARQRVTSRNSQDRRMRKIRSGLCSLSGCTRQLASKGKCKKCLEKSLQR